MFFIALSLEDITARKFLHLCEEVFIPLRLIILQPFGLSLFWVLCTRKSSLSLWPTSRTVSIVLRRIWNHLHEKCISNQWDSNRQPLCHCLLHTALPTSTTKDGIQGKNWLVLIEFNWITCLVSLLTNNKLTKFMQLSYYKVVGSNQTAAKYFCLFNWYSTCNWAIWGESR